MHGTITEHSDTDHSGISYNMNNEDKQSNDKDQNQYWQSHAFRIINMYTEITFTDDLNKT